MQLANKLSGALKDTDLSRLTEEAVAFLDGVVLLALANQKYQVKTIQDTQSYKFEGDYYGLLNELAVDHDLHYVTMRLNGLDSSSDYRGDSTQVLLIDLSFLDACVSQWATKKRH